MGTSKKEKEIKGTVEQDEFFTIPTYLAYNVRISKISKNSRYTAV
jgi:hypothetical protein